MKKIKIILAVFVFSILFLGTYAHAEEIIEQSDSSSTQAFIESSDSSSASDSSTTPNSLVSTDSSTTNDSSTTIPDGATDATTEFIDTSDASSTETDTPSIYEADVIIRAGDTLIYEGNATFSTEEINIIDSNGGNHSVNGNSVLALLYTLDASIESFSITDLQFYSFFNSFYLKCITATTEYCDNWQYVVGGTTPSLGMENTLLNGGESVGFYFGFPHKVELSETELEIGEEFTATSLKYNYVDNTWSILAGVNMGVTQTNPLDLYNPIVIKTASVDASGIAVFSLDATGEYFVGISEDYYYPSYAVTVIDATTTQNLTPTENQSSSSSSTKKFDTSLAISFIKDRENSNGSYGYELYTDWVAIGLAKSGANTANLKDFIKNDELDEGKNLTDYERRAMALMALGINPYNGTDFNYIQKIISFYDGKQFGSRNLYNDDIFAIIVLSKAGYSDDDEMIQNSAEFIKSAQNTDGSWQGDDITAAAIVALDIAGGNNESISRAKTYLRSSQKSDGGFGTSFATSWVLNMIKASGENVSDWQKNGNSPENYLINVQSNDGGLDEALDVNSRIWATAYALPATSGYSWMDILSDFSKVEENNDTEGSNGGGGETDENIEMIEKIIVSENNVLVTEQNEIEKSPNEKIGKKNVRPESVREKITTETTKIENTKVLALDKKDQTATAINSPASKVVIRAIKSVWFGFVKLINFIF